MTQIENITEDRYGRSTGIAIDRRTGKYRKVMWTWACDGMWHWNDDQGESGYIFDAKA